MLGTRFHDDVHMGGRGQFGKTPGRMNTNARKENPGGLQATVRGKGGLGGTSKTPGFNGAGPLEPKSLFKDGKVTVQQAQSISKAFALLDKTNKTPHVKSRKLVSTMTPVAGSAKKSNLKLSFTPAPPQVTDDASKATVRRPSAARLSIRAPRSGNFQTPDARGRPAHWDVGDIGPDMDEGVQLSNDIEAKVRQVQDEEEELEYMPPTAIDEINVLNAIRDEGIIDARFDLPSSHDLSILDPPEDNPFPVRISFADSKKPETRGRSASVSARSGMSGIVRARPASVADVRTDNISRAPSRTSSRPGSTVPPRTNPAISARSTSTVPSKFDVSSGRPGENTVRRPGTSLGIRSGESTARIAGKMVVPRRTDAKVTGHPAPQTHLVEALTIPVDGSALDDDFLFEV
ncbi:hypothetical protein RhiXN_06595 [Rhizoctonia solani]|uniref:Uncharacterized protein n=1 Tax=Rhizoctonia solani TaxID=456999 RepID=A0A8H8P0A5_9AGAM|nr:uncharacterized protein RhiXN_06595 [Rhizoctonia solani]QRW21606.1 hypothetical protein RhiXN_06595 [Rhizoctonia solani]